MPQIGVAGAQGVTAALHPWQGDVGNPNLCPLQGFSWSCPCHVVLFPPGSSRQHRPSRPPRTTPGRMGATDTPEHLCGADPSWLGMTSLGKALSPCPCLLLYISLIPVLSTPPTSLCSAGAGTHSSRPSLKPESSQEDWKSLISSTPQLQPWEGSASIPSQGAAQLGCPLCARSSSELLLWQSSWRAEIVT